MGAIKAIEAVKAEAVKAGNFGTCRDEYLKTSRVCHLGVCSPTSRAFWPGLVLFLALAGVVPDDVLAQTDASGATQRMTQPSAEDRALERTTIEDTTPQQKYRTAVREAGGGYKLMLEDCAQREGAERRNCQRQARSVYNKEMAAARNLLGSGQGIQRRARPVPEQTSPSR